MAKEKRYKGVNIPIELYEKIEPLMDRFGYKSFAEFVKDALREKHGELLTLIKTEEVENNEGA